MSDERQNVGKKNDEPDVEAHHVGHVNQEPAEDETETPDVEAHHVGHNVGHNVGH